MVVGAPVYVGIAIWIRRQLANASERASFGWSFYVTAALLGAVSYVVLDALHVGDDLAIWASILAAFGLRAAAIQFGLRLRKYKD